MLSDPALLISIALKALGYLAAVLSIGGPVFMGVCRPSDPVLHNMVWRTTIWAAVAFGTFTLAQIGVTAARLSGAGIWGSMDPDMLRIVWDSPIGQSALWGIGGVLAVIAGALRRGVFNPLAALGALLIAGAFAVVGHVRGSKGLQALLLLHLLTVSFWVAGLPPLFRAVSLPEGATLLRRFGRAAVGAVVILISAGGLLAYALVGSFVGLFTTVYGGVLTAKLLCVSVLLALAAGNKVRRVPALAAGQGSAKRSLQWAIGLEMICVCAILLLTAALTTGPVPPATP